ncbi:MAG: hypothetical protein AAGL69_11950 [Pseudomonadota bacterium]
MKTLAGRRRIGLIAWAGLAGATLVWLWDAGSSVHWLIWPALLAPFGLLLPGMLRPSRNTWLLALLASIGYATTGLMDAIANPGSLTAAAALAVVALTTFFLLIPAIRTLPSAASDH